MSKIKCVIVDDEELARKLLETYVEKLDFLEWKGSFENPLEALDYFKTEAIDLLFLDIQMPQIKGTDFAQLIAKSGMRIIFTTAYSEYALKGFELSALDYLLKPITFNRFLSAVEKYPKQETTAQDTLVIKSGYDFYKVPYNDIVFIKSESEYVTYNLESGKKIMAYQSLSKLSDSLPSTFMRIHRSYIVNRAKISGLKGREVLLSGGHQISVSDTYYETLKKVVFNS